MNCLLKNTYGLNANSLIETVLNANSALINEIKENEEISRLLMQFSEETAKKYL